MVLMSHAAAAAAAVGSAPLPPAPQAGDHVRVLNGPHAGERGMVVSVEGPQCVLLPDTRQAELKVFVRDLTEAKESGTGGGEGV